MNSLPLRPFQIQTIRLFEKASAHVTCVAPTGAGKSLIFETLARKPLARTLIISPLRALIRQQEISLEKLGVQIDPGLKISPKNPQPAAWVSTPEALVGRTRAGWRATPDTLLVVDECHCIEEWGDSFRPEFALLPELPKLWNLRHSLWLSATLTPDARQRLSESLPSPQHWIGSFGLHPRLRTKKLMVPKLARPKVLEYWLETHPQPGVIFCSSRRSCEEVATRLEIYSKAQGIVGLYHAGLTREERLGLEARTRSQQIRWLAATSAFGMGMNFPHLSWVLLWEPPYSIPSLAQMLGRCGRSLESEPEALLLWEESELAPPHSPEKNAQKIRDFFKSSDEPSVWLTEFFS